VKSINNNSRFISSVYR